MDKAATRHYDVKNVPHSSAQAVYRNTKIEGFQGAIESVGFLSRLGGRVAQ
ncbi:hypothetical protein CBNA_1036 [Coxiella burnetii str. Namibia]|nr:hypothetical protein CBNA_1036 [Coxiella burnetii str. Namibia]